MHFSQGTDVFRWNLHESGKFSVESMYRALIQSDVPVDNNKKIWKMKIPLKKKIFAWYLLRGVIHTTNYLIRRNWHESTQCVLCQIDETIKHLFFQCKLARSICSIWSVIQIASGLSIPCSVANIFGNWLHRIDHKFRILLRVGALPVVSSFCLCRNDKAFNGKSSSLMHIIHRCTRTFRLWSSLQRVVNRDLFTEVCIWLVATVRDIFTQHGWQHDLRIDPLQFRRLTVISSFLYTVYHTGLRLGVFILVMHKPSEILKL